MSGCIAKRGPFGRPGRKVAGLRQWITWVSAALMLQVFALACDYPFGPDEGDVLPTLWQISFSDLGNTFIDGGVLWLMGSPSDTSFRLLRKQRVPVQLSSSSGDREDLGLYRLDCPGRAGGYIFRCFRFNISFTEEYDMAEIERRVAAIGGRFAIRSSSFASIVIFDPDAVNRHARDAGSWPGVWYSWFAGIGCHPAGCPTQYNHLTLPVRVDHGPPVPGDGTLQVSPGDTLRYTYTQPTGQTLEVTLRVP